MNRLRQLKTRSFGLLKQDRERQYWQRLKLIFGSNLIRLYPNWGPSGSVTVDEVISKDLGIPTNITFGVEGIGDGRTGIMLGGTSDVVLSSSVKSTVSNKMNGVTFLLWLKVGSGVYTDDNYGQALTVYGDSNNSIFIGKINSHYLLNFGGWYGGTQFWMNPYCYETGWFLLTVSIGETSASIYINGLKALVANVPTWNATAVVTMLIGKAVNGINHWLGDISYVGIIDRVITDTEAYLCRFNEDYLPYTGFGDSKTQMRVYQPALNANGYLDTARSFGVIGATVSSWRAVIDTTITNLNIIGKEPRWILSNLGANDVANMPQESTFKTNYLYILDALHTRFPIAKIYVAKAWRRGYDSSCDTLASWIDYIVIQRSWLRQGFDERVWMKGSDDGVTYTSDGVHYNQLGGSECSTQWRNLIEVSGDYGIELLANSGFESVGSWSLSAGDGAISDETVIVHSGVKSKKITAGVLKNTYIFQANIAVDQGKVYEMSFWVYGDGTNQGIYQLMDVTNGYANIITPSFTGTAVESWTLISRTFISPDGCAQVQLNLKNPNIQGGYVYYDDVSIKRRQ